MDKSYFSNSGKMKVSLEILRKIASGAIRVAGVGTTELADAFSSLYFGKYGGYKERKFYPSDLSKTLERLKRKGYVRLETSPRGRALRLTPEGQALLTQYEIKGIKPKNQKRWDKKWRVVIFDVREEDKRLRDRIREQLQHWGFCLLQKSVWVYPYDCEKMIELLKTAHRARHDVLYLTVTNMAQDNKLRKHFGFSLR